MIDSETILKYLSQNKARLQVQYQLVKIGLFGSYAREENTNESDIDILVEFEENTTDLYSKKMNLKNEIQTKFNVPVDICREKYIKSVFRDQILTETKYV
jgi:uncharacterized protein